MKGFVNKEKMLEMEKTAKFVFSFTFVLSIIAMFALLLNYVDKPYLDSKKTSITFIVFLALNFLSVISLIDLKYRGLILRLQYGVKGEK